MSQLKNVVPSIPNTPSHNNRYFVPSCPQYRGFPRGGLVYSSNNVLGNCYDNGNGPLNPPYDFICDKYGRNCRSFNGYSRIYRNPNAFCCKAANNPNNNLPYYSSNPYYTNSYPYSYPYNPYYPYHPHPRPDYPDARYKCCEENNVNECAKCLTRHGVISSNNQSANHFGNMQKCKYMC